MTVESAGQDAARQSVAKVFISYSRKDMAFVDRLGAAMKGTRLRAVDRSH